MRQNGKRNDGGARRKNGCRPCVLSSSPSLYAAHERQSRRCASLGTATTATAAGQSQKVEKPPVPGCLHSRRLRGRGLCSALGAGAAWPGERQNISVRSWKPTRSLGGAGNFRIGTRFPMSGRGWRPPSTCTGRGRGRGPESAKISACAHGSPRALWAAPATFASAHAFRCRGEPGGPQRPAQAGGAGPALPAGGRRPPSLRGAAGCSGANNVTPRWMGLFDAAHTPLAKVQAGSAKSAYCCALAVGRGGIFLRRNTRTGGTGQGNG